MRMAHSNTCRGGTRVCYDLGFGTRWRQKASNQLRPTCGSGILRRCPLLHARWRERGPFTNLKRISAGGGKVQQSFRRLTWISAITLVSVISGLAQTPQTPATTPAPAGKEKKVK